jgi:hypothetical protein
MTQSKPPSDKPNVITRRSEQYRESYANSVGVRISVWDFFLIFGIIRQDSAEEVQLEHLQGVYLSPQQAKAFFNLLGHNLAQYEQAFGPIALEPQYAPPGGPVN